MLLRRGVQAQSAEKLVETPMECKKCPVLTNKIGFRVDVQSKEREALEDSAPDLVPEDSIRIGKNERAVIH